MGDHEKWICGRCRVRIFYVLRAGCAWRMIPREYPPKSTVDAYFARFRDAGVWEHIMTALRERCRVQAGRETSTSRWHQ